MRTACSFITLFTLFLYFKESIGQSVDVCAEAEIIPFDAIRIYAYERPPWETPICDRNVINETKWYRATEDMVTNATKPDICGTTYPLWLSGNIPNSTNDIGKEMDGTVCVPGIHTACDNTYSIKILNCGSFRVYKLKKPNTCPQAYCFGYGVKDTPPTQNTSKPVVKHEFSRKNGFIPYQFSNFKCVFPFLSSPNPNKTFLYQIYWYINGNTVFVTNAVKEEDFSKTLFNEDNGITRMGVQISCSVRVKYNPRGLPGPMSETSEEIFAGIQLISQSINIPRRGSGKVELNFTVPFPCRYKKEAVHIDDIDYESCPLRIELAIPKSTPGVCESRLAGQSECGIEINPSELDSNIFMNIRHQDSSDYKLTNAQVERKLYLKTYQFDISKAWTDIILPVINVHIDEDEDRWQGKSCYAHSDPHMKTFDQRPYENQNDGTFIMYRNNDSNGNIMEVQTKYTTCNYGNNIFCVCGIAVRFAGDVFVINRCPGLKRNIFTFRSCIDDILDVRKINELNYKMYMPTGTYVQTRLWRYNDKNVMEVDIFPSRADIGNSEGLCSRLMSNKLFKRDGSEVPYSTYPDDFSKSWSVDYVDNLLEMPDETVTQLDPMRTTYTVCHCDNEGEIENEAICSSDKTIACDVLQTKPYQKNTCYAKRKRRSLQTRLAYIPDNFVQHIERQKRKTVKDSKVFWTKEEAQEFCIDYMNKSAGYKQCLGVPNVNPDHAIADCVADIQLTNSTSWAIASREGLKTLCLKELSQNNTLQNETESDGISIVDSILSVSCPGECNQRGTCKNGTCICHEEYGAADCSIYLRDPPIVNGINLDSGGLCDKLHCSKAIVEGDLFLDRETLTCKMQEFDMPYQGNPIFSETIDIGADHNSISDIICPFPKVRKRRSTITSFISGYKISVSNDGNEFSPSHLMYILDSTCQDTMNVSGEIKFILKDGFCFIKGQCIVEGTQDGSNICNVCRYRQNLFTWSKQTSNSKCEEQSSKLWIIGAVLGCLALMLCLGIIFVIYKKKYRVVGMTSPPSYKQ